MTKIHLKVHLIIGLLLIASVHQTNCMSFGESQLNSDYYYYLDTKENNNKEKWDPSEEWDLNEILKLSPVISPVVRKKIFPENLVKINNKNEKRILKSLCTKPQKKQKKFPKTKNNIDQKKPSKRISTPTKKDIRERKKFLALLEKTTIKYESSFLIAKKESPKEKVINLFT